MSPPTAPAPSGRYPAGLLPSLRAIQLVCPKCKGDLLVLADSYQCEVCSREYTLHGGIPDFRLFPDPYLDYEEDRKRTGIVLEGLGAQPDLESLLNYYWSFSDVTPVPLRAKFVRSAMLAGSKAGRILRQLFGTAFSSPLPTDTTCRVLEVGSGTGGFLAAAATRFPLTVGTDIAMRWLHVSRRRFMDLGLPVPPLVCCCAEHLPFPDGAFDLVVSTATLEFVRSQEEVVDESARVLAPDGALYIQTVNRFALSGDPYVYLWGVGFLPRAWQARFVRWRRDASYEHIKLLSYRGLNTLVAKRFQKLEIVLPDVDDDALARFPRPTRLLFRAYRIATTFRPVEATLRWLGPGWDLKATGPGRARTS